MRTITTITGVLLLLAAEQVSAACPENPETYVLSRLTPVGHYAQRAVVRITEGIERAKEEPESSEEEFSGVAFNALTQMVSTYYGFIDSDLRSIEYSKDLTDISACLHIDLAILEAKLEEVRCEMNDAYERRSITGVRMLQELSKFVQTRIRYLVDGALDTSFVDKDWQNSQSFDAPFDGWCCVRDTEVCAITSSDDCDATLFFPTGDRCTLESVCSDAEEAPDAMRLRYSEQCPFDSNYLAPSTSGYGCDLDALSAIPLPEDDISTTTKELAALRHVAETRKSYLENIDHIQTVTLKTDTLVDNTLLSEQERSDLGRFGTGATDDIDHRRVWGCFADFTPEERDLLPAPERVEINHGKQGTLTPGVHPSQEWVLQPARGAFRLQKDHLAIWKLFLALHHRFALLRELPSYLKNPSEFLTEADRKNAAEKDAQFFNMFSGPREDLRKIWQSFMLKQETEEAAILPKVHDTPLQIRDTLAPVRSAMRQNIDLVTTVDAGPRRFASNFAYFLRRSCIYRPCNEKLETILKILFTDECFPYASGAFPERSSWPSCLEEVQKL